MAAFDERQINRAPAGTFATKEHSAPELTLSVLSGPHGFDQFGYDPAGRDANGFDRSGIHWATGTSLDPDGFNRQGITPEGYDRAGFNSRGFDRAGRHQFTGTRFDSFHRDVDGFDEYGLDSSGRDRAGRTATDRDAAIIDGVFPPELTDAHVTAGNPFGWYVLRAGDEFYSANRFGRTIRALDRDVAFDSVRKLAAAA